MINVDAAKFFFFFFFGFLRSLGSSVEARPNWLQHPPLGVTAAEKNREGAQDKNKTSAAC